MPSSPFPVRGRRRAVATAVVAVVMLLATTVFSIQSAPSADALSSFDQQLLAYINEHRVNRGLQPFSEYPSFSNAAKAWSTTMRNGSPAPCGNPGGAFRHDTYARISTDGVPPGTTSAGENIAWTCGPRGHTFPTSWTYGAMPARCRGNIDFTSALLQFCQWIDSTGHRQAIENPNFRWIGLGSAERTSGGQTAVFSTARFSSAPGGAVEPSETTCKNQQATVNLALGQSPTEGDDVIVGTPWADVIDGRGGNDLICGGGGGDVIDGGSGNDRIYGQGGHDTIRGGIGDDRIFGAAGNDTLLGQAGSDRLVGNGGRDVIDGGGGSDFLNGRQDIDRLAGGDGADVLRGGGGDDALHGDRGDDDLSGGGGTDWCDGADGVDRAATCEAVSNVP